MECSSRQQQRKKCPAQFDTRGYADRIYFNEARNRLMFDYNGATCQLQWGSGPGDKGGDTSNAKWDCGGSLGDSIGISDDCTVILTRTTYRLTWECCTVTDSNINGNPGQYSGSVTADCSSCAAGKRLIDAAIGDESSACTDCSAGTYTSRPSSWKCLQCKDTNPGQIANTDHTGCRTCCSDDQECAQGQRGLERGRVL